MEFWATLILLILGGVMLSGFVFVLAFGGMVKDAFEVGLGVIRKPEGD